VELPGPGKVPVRTAAWGVCHSDLHVVEGPLPMPPPCILGHEPAGVVEAVGDGVAGFAPGDRGMGCISAWCGTCEMCLRGKPHLCGGASLQRAAGAKPRLSKNGDVVLQFANLSSFAEQMLTHERSLVKMHKDMPLDRAALIGCGVTTGVGAVLNTARIEPGSTCAVIACGGVRLCAVPGWRTAGASRIVAVDNQPWKLELARKLGATDTVDVSAGDPAAQVMQLTSGGVDYAFECLGTAGTVKSSVDMLKRGGTAVFVGIVPIGQRVDFHIADITFQEKRLIGSLMGSNRFRLDMPRYVDFYLDGRLRLDEMISARIGLDGVNDAFDRLRKGDAARQVIVFDA